MSTDINVYIIRNDIQALVSLLCADDNERVEATATSINGHDEEPATIYRAALEIADLRDEDDFDPAEWPELFTVDSEGAVTPVETLDREADRLVAKEIIKMLAERFGPNLAD